MMRKLYIVFSLILFSAQAMSQIIPDSVLVKMFDRYGKLHPENTLFTHTDKTIYTNNETIWFSSYLLKSSDTLDRHTVLSAVLVREDNRRIVIQNNFLMKYGLSFGQMNLPDSIPPGNYRLLTFSNVLNAEGFPLANFDQQLTIKSMTKPDFEARLTLLDTIPVNGKLRALVTASVAKNQTGGFEIGYSVGGFEGKTLKSGARAVSYPIEISSQQFSSLNAVLTCSVRHLKNIRYLTVKLPEIKKTGISVRFFPEGGSLNEDIESVIAFESLTADGLPVNMSGVLFDNERPIDTITASSYGIGNFRLQPRMGHTYSLKVKANKFLKADTVLQLPTARSHGVVIQLPKAVVTDTLQFQLFSKNAQTVQVVVHSKEKAYATFMARTNAKGGRVSVLLADLPVGLATITVIGNSGSLSERMFFAHSDQMARAEITTDKEIFNRKEKVKLNIKVSNTGGKPEPGVLSVAVVQENRIESNKFKDIALETYLAGQIGSIPTDPSGSGLNNDVYLENILLVRGWRNYTWRNIAEQDLDATVFPITVIPRITAQVMVNEKPYKKPANVVILRDSTTDMYTTSQDGSLIMAEDKLAITYGRPLIASVNGKDQLLYKILLNNPLFETGKMVSKSVTPFISGLEFISQSTEDDVMMQGLSNGISLKEVNIKANANSNFIYGITTNACGDWVCEYDVLNCRNHPNGTPPVEGHLYNTNFTKVPIIYSGCLLPKKGNSKLDGIYLAKEFYGFDTSPEGMLTPQFLSTLAWKPGVLTDESGMATIEFYTGDIADTFKIVVQGVGKTGVFSGSQLIRVK